MKKKVIIILGIVSIGFILFSLYYYKKVDKQIKKVVKKIEKNSKNLLMVNIKTINYNQNRDFQHYTNRDNILFLDKKLEITKGGISKDGVINLFFNPNKFNKITKFKEEVFIGYKDGFLLLNKNNINFFDLSKEVNKCIRNEESLFCISDTDLIYSKDLRSFFHIKYKKKIKDIAFYEKDILLLLDKELIIVKKGKDRKIELKSDINTLLVKNDNLYLLSDRKISILKDEKIILYKKITGINNIIRKDGVVYYISFDGIIYKNDKQILKIDAIINNSFISNNKILLLTSNYIYEIVDDKLIEKNNSKSLIQQNFITKFYQNKNNIYIGFFNKGVYIYNNFTKEIEPFIRDLNGINDIKIVKDKLYIATTNALEVFDLFANKIAKYSKKEGLLGSNLSSIEIIGKNIYLGTEGGVSKKKKDSFKSIYGLNGLINNRVNCLKRYHNHLYVGTLGGISKLDNLKIIKNFGVEYFSSPWISALEVVKDNLFIGSYGGGLYRYNGKKIKKISKKRVFINPNAIIGSKNFVFAGTLNKGILIYDINHNKSYFYDELPSLNITALHIEKDNIFVGSDFGFWIMPLNKLIN